MMMASPSFSAAGKAWGPAFMAKFVSAFGFGGRKVNQNMMTMIIEKPRTHTKNEKIKHSSPSQVNPDRK